MFTNISGLAHLATAKQDFFIASTAFTFVLFDVVSDFRCFVPTDLAGSAGCLKPELRTVLLKGNIIRKGMPSSRQGYESRILTSVWQVDLQL